MKKAFRRPRTWYHPRLIVRRLWHSWPFLVWVGAGALFFLLYTGNQQFAGITGVVETIEDPIAPLETARLKKLDVTLGQHVKAGDIVARMDTALIDAEVAVQESLAHEETGAINRYQEDTVGLVSRFDKLVQDAREALEAEKQRQQRDEAELAALRTELERREALLRKRLIDERDVGDLRPSVAALEHQVAAYPALIRLYEDRLKAAQTDRERINGLLLQDGETVSDAIARKTALRGRVLETTLQQARLRKDLYTLRATRDGRVSQINVREGSVVQAGQPILAIVVERSNRIIGFLPEEYEHDIDPGVKALVYRVSGGEKYEASIVTVSPNVRALPGRVAPIGGQPMRGRRVVLKIEGDHDLLPGETVRIQDAGPGLVASLLRRFTGHSVESETEK